MKSSVLLILSLMAGCGASADVTVRACPEGWVQFTCNSPKPREYETADVRTSNKNTIRATQNDMWITDGRFSLYHDTQRKNLKVAIKHLQWQDFGEYECLFYQKSKNNPKRTEVDVEPESSCKTPSIQTAYTSAETTITCQYSGKYRVGIRFLCKENSDSCEDILSTKPAQRSNGMFTLTETLSGFRVSISHVSSQDAGVYWCGAEPPLGNRVTLSKIQLEVEVPPSTATPSTIAATSQHPVATASVSSPPSITDTAQEDSQSTLVITATICVAKLALVVVLVFVYRRFKSSKNKTNGQAQNKEDRIYEEIQESSQKSDTRTAMKTVYVTANFPTNPSAFMPYCKVNFKNSSADVTGNTYSTVRDSSQFPTYSVINEPSFVSEPPLYSIINHPPQP